ncbi:hypothetical protein MPSEU_000799600 [Mayamaea pseudoterrestris]|nr:hypothetical protein MPSEU_000799600 [Mayamaea pseudoterrestris]
MPVYLCQSGSEEPEPWRYGIQVYASPFNIDLSDVTPRAGRDLVVASNISEQPTTAGHPIRRVRHAEVVLVDDVCVAHERYWLRLRWPGSKGGFAGYIAMGLVTETPKQDLNLPENQELRFIVEGAPGENEMGGNAEDDFFLEKDDDPSREEDRPDSGSMESPSEPLEASSSATLTCLRTGVPFPSAAAMPLLAAYDDGFQPPAALPSFFATEPVFCRICREGLHDDADEDQPAPTAATEGEEIAGRNTSDALLGDEADDDEPVEETWSLMAQHTAGPVQPHPSYIANSEALQNPFLAPCECAGSMAFVHYLCVEQWRCRSRHPKAMNGHNCETCGAAYTLPPPLERPNHLHQLDQEDWLEAMPPHVMQALRQPHFCWQVGAAIVRRRWLRPLAPIVMSPIVALYCRARRLLKKRGVSRRRWACSLCRRRARWKCVRCLRSYYCSRQCQNVSWHILHKHVCYKPSRLWASVLAYGVATLALFPGILRDPLMYDLGLCLIPTSFVIMGVIGGGAAMAMKRFAGMDVRGRFLEMIVLACTIYLFAISWGLVRGFFGDTSACLGAFGEYYVAEDDAENWYILHAVRKVILQQGKSYYGLWDRLPRKLNSVWFQAAVCSDTCHASDCCFEHLPKANPDFFLAEHGGSKCAADLIGVAWLHIIAFATFVGCAIWKQQERERRRHGRRPVRGEWRLHQD